MSASPPSNPLFKAPDSLWAFQCIALVPLLRGLCHLDVKRFHRRLHYRPQVTIELTSQIVALALAYPLCRALGNYSAVLAIVLVQECIRTIGSHVAAERPYRWSCSHAHLRRMFTFGWPLLANGLLLFAIMQGDRLIVGTAFTTRQLGLYAMAFTLANAPFMLIGSVLTPLALPLLSAVQDQRAAFERRVRLCNAVYALAAGVAGIPLLLSAPWLLERVCGAEYAKASGVFVWLVSARMVWLLRVAPTLTAMARADTRNALLANVFRVTGVALAVLVAVLGYSLEAIAVAALAGELIAALASVIMVRLRHRVSVLVTLVPLQPLLVAFALAHALGRLDASNSLAFFVVASVALSIFFVCIVVMLVPPIRIEMTRAVVGMWARFRWRMLGLHRMPQ